jgi:hypothetical protein
VRSALALKLGRQYVLAGRRVSQIERHCNRGLRIGAAGIALRPRHAIAVVPSGGNRDVVYAWLALLRENNLQSYERSRQVERSLDCELLSWVGRILRKVQGATKR